MTVFFTRKETKIDQNLPHSKTKKKCRHQKKKQEVKVSADHEAEPEEFQ